MTYADMLDWGRIHLMIRKERSLARGARVVLSPGKGAGKTRVELQTLEGKIVEAREEAFKLKLEEGRPFHLALWAYGHTAGSLVNARVDDVTVEIE